MDAAAARFAYRVPEAFFALGDPTDPLDPVLRQVVPSPDELVEVEGFTADPVADRENRVVSGMIRKYDGRALLVVTSACAVHCRYCFRREYPYSDPEDGGRALEEALQAVAGDATIREAILSGGDPFVLPDGALGRWTRGLAAIPHVARLRVHTRVPGVLPERVDDGLAEALRTRLPTWVVVHFNHPRELTGAAARACGRLVDSGYPVLNQSVLLRGVNDDAVVLAELFERLVDARVKPYYLHQLDRVRGAAHFEVPEAEGLRLVEAVRARVSGLAMPAYVRDVPGSPSKVPVARSVGRDHRPM